MKKFEITHPMDNQMFLNAVSNAFEAFVESGTSRSTAKLKPLHGSIAQDIAIKLGNQYIVKSQGYGDDKEASIGGRYMDKKVDITVEKKNINGTMQVVAGIAVKFVMQNYSQNSNNYFENMLGETANIRSNRFPYFQIFIILDKLPYYRKNKTIKKWETFTSHNAKKYVILSEDNADVYYHTPNKTLIYVVHVPDNEDLQTLQEYMDYYHLQSEGVEESLQIFENIGSSVIINDWKQFLDKVYYTIKAI